MTVNAYATPDYVLIADAWNGAATQLMFTKRLDLPGDGPKPTKIECGFIDPGALQYQMFKGKSTYGKSEYSYGSVTLSNVYGALDTIKSYDFDGRTVTLYEGTPGALFPQEFAVVYTATIAKPEYTMDSVSFIIKGKQIDLSIPVPTGIFAGTNAGAAGVEGGDDIKGKYKQCVLGRNYNIPTTCCNYSKQIYAVSPANGISVLYMGSNFKVYDKGVALVYGGAYSSQADMEANAPVPGTFRVWEVGGYIRLGSKPIGELTCDVANYGRSTTAKPGNLIADLLTICGVGYDSASISALNTVFTGECGVFIRGGESIESVLDLICSACGAFWYFSNLGVFKVGMLADPSSLTPTYSINSGSMLVYSANIQASSDNGGLPAHTVTLQYQKNNTIETDPAASVPASRKEWLKQQWRSYPVTTNVSAIKLAHPLSKEMIIETSLSKINVAEADRRYGLYSIVREILEIEVPLNIFGSNPTFIPGMCISVDLESTTIAGTTHRYGYVNRKMVLIGWSENRTQSAQKYTLTLWG